MLLQHIVKEAFECAFENGYDFDRWTHQQIAIDMASYDSELERFPLDKIVEEVKA
jgi:hypothetical protein